MGERLTDVEFEALKQKRDADVQRLVTTFAEKWGVDPSEVRIHVSGQGACYCDCPNGPCQHIWDGPEYREDNLSSVTCSRCGAPRPVRMLGEVLTARGDTLDWAADLVRREREVCGDEPPPVAYTVKHHDLPAGPMVSAEAASAMLSAASKLYRANDCGSFVAGDYLRDVSGLLETAARELPEYRGDLALLALRCLSPRAYAIGLYGEVIDLIERIAVAQRRVRRERDPLDPSEVLGATRPNQFWWRKVMPHRPPSACLQFVASLSRGVRLRHRPPNRHGTFLTTHDTVALDRWGDDR